MKVGFASVPITPPLGTPLGGYAKLRFATRIDSDLHARALYAQSDGVEVGIISFDLLGVDADLVSRIRSTVSERTHIHPDAVMVAATHTHSSPAEMPQAPWLSREKPSTRFRDYVADMGATSLELARNQAQEARFWLGCASVGDLVASNRRREDGPFNPTVTALVARCPDDEGDGDPIGVLVHFTCHPTISGESGTEISAEFPGWAISALSRSIGGTALFVNGPAGDISTRFRRREQTSREAKRIGTIVGGAAVMAVANALPLADGNLRYVRTKVHAAVGSEQSAAELDSTVENAKRRISELKRQHAAHGQIRIAETDLEGLEIALRISQDLGDIKEVTTEIQAVSIGDLILLGLPGEPFVEYGEMLARPDKRVMTLGYVNDYVGYLPTLQSFDDGGYETTSAVLSRKGVQQVIDAAKRTLEQV